MLSAVLPEHADNPNAPTNDSTAAATIPRLPTAIAYRRRVFRLPDGRPVRLAVGRDPGTGFSGAGLAASAATSSGSASLTSSVALDGLRRLRTRRVWVRTSSVR